LVAATALVAAATTTTTADTTTTTGVFAASSSAAVVARERRLELGEGRFAGCRNRGLELRNGCVGPSRVGRRPQARKYRPR
jgi:hypothetical protein